MPSEVKIRNLETHVERVKPRHGVCGSCGMATKHPREYHPFAACLMFTASRDGDIVRGNIEAVICHVERATASHAE